MSGSSRNPEIGQAFYGSFSGYHDYRILAGSLDLSEREKSVIQDVSNLGGTALTGTPAGPVWSAYDLDRKSGRRAFSRTIFLGQGPRGNDYLAHVLVLGPEALSVLRGDLFLLAELGLFSAEKPKTETVLPKLALDADGVEQHSCRMLGKGRDDRISPSRLAGVLRALAHGPLALAEEDGHIAEALCRSVLAFLPPKDREHLSFCSRFSLPRSAPFHLALYHPGDRELAQSHLRVALLDDLPEAEPGDPFESWVSEVVRGIYPLYGLSLLELPDQAAPRAAAFRTWASSVLAGKAESSESEGLERQNLRLSDLVDDPRNQVLEPIRYLQLAAAVAKVLEKVTTVLTDTVQKPLSLLAEACRRVQEQDPEGKTMERLLPSGGTFLKKVTVRIVLFLLVPKPPWLEKVYGSGGALLSTPEEAAKWIFELHEASPVTCEELLTAWLLRWRGKQGSELLAEIGKILEELSHRHPQETAAEAVHTCRDLLERTAPPGSASNERAAWFLEILRGVRPRLGVLFPARDAASLVIREDLLPFLTEEEVSELAPGFVSGHLQATFEGIERIRKNGGLAPPSILLPLVRVCRDGFLERGLDGLAWDVQDQPMQWDLAGELTVQASALLKTSPSRPLQEDLVWLLWAASRLIAKQEELPSSKVYQKLEAGLNTLLEVGAKGLMDLVLWAVYRFLLSERGFQPRISTDELKRVKKQAWEDARDASPNDDAFAFFLVRWLYLDQVLF